MWQRTGVPENPVAWIVRTARNGAIDRLRREARGTEKSALAARLDAGVAALEPFDALDAPTVPDDRLGLIFACAHPSLNEESQVALTLRSVGGLTTDEIAAAFLVPPATMAQRLVRAKRKIRDAGIPFSLPGAAVLSDRVDAVCSVIYLIFNAGYIASSGDDALRDDLCTEAVRLATLLAELLPAQAEVHGLVALLYLQHARRAARTDAGGDIITLEDQDRTRWDRADIDRGMRALLRAAALRHEGPYQLQAAIAAVHARAPDPAATNWPGIAALYARLQTYAHSPIVELNRAVAIAMSDGPNAGLAIVEASNVKARLRPTICCRRRAPICSNDWNAGTKLLRRTHRRSRSRAIPPSGDSLRAASTSARGVSLDRATRNAPCVRVRNGARSRRAVRACCRSSVLGPP